MVAKHPMLLITGPKSVTCLKGSSGSWGNTAVEGIRCYGAIQDSQAPRREVVAATRYPKHWLTVGIRANEYIMTQSLCR